MNVPPEFPTRETRGLHRIVCWVLAALFFCIGLIGVVVPGLPTTPFVLLTCYFLVRVSPTFHQKVMNLPVFGPALKDWDKYKGVSRRVKFTAYAMVTGLVSLTFLFTKPSWVAMSIIGVFALIGILTVFWLPTISPTDVD